MSCPIDLPGDFPPKNPTDPDDQLCALIGYITFSSAAASAINDYLNGNKTCAQAEQCIQDAYAVYCALPCFVPAVS